MRKDQSTLLNQIQRIEKNQLYLMEQPQTPQQKFLHLFAHRHLLQQKMIHKNIDKNLDLLPGSFAQSNLLLAYTSLCINNHIQAPQASAPLLTLVDGWVNYYPSLKDKKQVLLGQVVLQDSRSAEDLQGFYLYLTYLNLISFDLWKMLRGPRPQQQFLKGKGFKAEMDAWSQTNLRHVDAPDLLTFISSCLPKTVFNIILEKPSLPTPMRSKYPKYQCLYCNQSTEFTLRSSKKLPLLLKSIFQILLQLELTITQTRFMMLLAIRFYYVFHHDRRINTAQIFVYCYNKLTDDLRKGLVDQFSLFLKIIAKMGKDKFTSFLEKNSPFLLAINEVIKKKPMIGIAQESASPYNTIGIAQAITIDRGASAIRYFEVLQQFSIFYYRLQVVNMDITLKLYYLGEVGAPSEVKSLLFTQQKKSGSFKNCINAMKKGLYMFQFDNSYSWINRKTVRFQNVVYTPLEIKSSNSDEWIGDFYMGIFQNQVANIENVYIVSNSKSNRAGQQTALLSRGRDTFTLMTNTTENSSYQYQTDHAGRMEEKIKEIIKSHPQMHLLIDGKQITQFDDVRQFLTFKTQKPPKENQPKNKIEYYEEPEVEEQRAEVVEEEIVPKEMEQSVIIKEEQQKESKEEPQKQAEKKEQNNISLPVSEKQPSSPPKEQITCSSNETQNFYTEES